MGRRRSRAIRQTAVMEVRQVAGVQTRARALALAAEKAGGTASPTGRKVAAGGMPIPRLQLRCRRPAARPERRRSLRVAAAVPGPAAVSLVAAVAGNSVDGGGDCPGDGAGDYGCCISDGSSNSSCEPVAAAEGTNEESRSGGTAASEDGDEASSADRDCDGRLERWPRIASPCGEIPSPTRFPSAAEIDEFFTTAEDQERRRFADKYNYDVAKDVPMEGRYEWIATVP